MLEVEFLQAWKIGSTNYTQGQVVSLPAETVRFLVASQIARLGKQRTPVQNQRTLHVAAATAVTYTGAESVAVPAAAAPIDTAHLTLPGVVIPPSGKVLVRFEGSLAMTGSTSVLWGCTVVPPTGSPVAAWTNTVVAQQYSGRVTASGVVTGTPGQVVTLRWDHSYSGTGGVATFKNGTGWGSCTLSAHPLSA